MSKKRMGGFLRILEVMFPEAHCELNHSNSFELVIAVLMSAQCTDEMVNRVTEKLFQKYKKPADFLAVPLAELEYDIRQIGLFRNKAKNIRGLCELLINQHQSEVPDSYEELVKLPGVGRKTANVVLSTAFGIPAIAVDTHVERVSKRLSFAKEKDTPLQVENSLMNLIPKALWSQTHHRLIFFGRYHCKAQNPKCGGCPLVASCKEGKKRMKKMTEVKNGY